MFVSKESRNVYTPHLDNLAKEHINWLNPQLDKSMPLLENSIEIEKNESLYHSDCTKAHEIFVIMSLAQNFSVRAHIKLAGCSVDASCLYKHKISFQLFSSAVHKKKKRARLLRHF